jgi:hypothetical protein
MGTYLRLVSCAETDHGAKPGIRRVSSHDHLPVETSADLHYQDPSLNCLTAWSTYRDCLRPCC